MFDTAHRRVRNFSLSSFGSGNGPRFHRDAQPLWSLGTQQPTGKNRTAGCRLRVSWPFSRWVQKALLLVPTHHDERACACDPR